MSDYGNGRWGTGSRPLMPGPAQSAYDQGANDRRWEEYRQQQQNRDEMYKRQRERQQKHEEEVRRNREGAYRTGTPTSVSDDDDSFESFLFFAGIGGFTFILVSLWNAFVGQFHPTQPILAAIVKHGVWAVGVGGIVGGILLHEWLMKIVKLILILAALFFGSAIAYGIYQGVTGAG